MKRRCMGCMEVYLDEFEVCPSCGYVYGSNANEAYHLAPGTILNKKYIVGKSLGYGGFGVTYIGWDSVLEKKVAIKEYFPGEFATRMPEQPEVTVFSGEREEQFESGMLKFVDEAKRLAKFQDESGIVSVYDSFEENKTAYIVMEYLDGESLKEKLKRDGNMSVEEALPIIKSVLVSLEKVHEEGIIHRDIAPDNIYISSSGEVKLIDFGASRFATTKHSKSLSVILKPGYSPEEQYRSRGDQGPWTDVYSVAATFYKMLTGITPMDAMERGVKDTLKEPSKLGVKIPKSIENAIMNAMNTGVEGRTQSAKKFLDELEAAEVKRIKIKHKKIDIGKWPLWAKLSSGMAAATVTCFGLLLTSGVIQFNIASLGYSSVPMGMTRVPNLISMSGEEAETKSLNADLVYQVYGKEYSNDIPEGRVLAQNMIGGSVVDEGKTIAVILSAGVAPTYVPDLVGYKEDKVDEVVNASELEHTDQYEESLFAPGTVASQSIPSETLVDSGSNIDLIVSTGTEGYDETMDTTIPDVVGKSLDSGVRLAGNNKVYLYVSDYVYDDNVKKNTIISQDVEAGLGVKQGEEFSVVVSRGKELVIVPDMQYSSVVEAQTELESLGLVVEIEYVESDVVAKDYVVSQGVESNSRVEKGSTVSIFVSKGNELADNSIKASDINVTREVQKSVEDNNKGNSADDSSGENGFTIAINTKNSLITVPNVTGQSETSAKSQLQGAGLYPVVCYKHSSSVSDGCVISQTGAGSQVTKGTTISLVVCNNEKITKYRTREISEETMESGNSAVDGWTLYDTTWSNYGNWSGWSRSSVASSEAREVEQKTQYRYRSIVKATSPPAGYSLYNNSPVGETLSGWSSTKTSQGNPGSSKSLVGNQDLVKLIHTHYHYYHYHNDYTNNTKGWDSVNAGSGGDPYVTIKKSTAKCQITITDVKYPYSYWADVGGRGAESVNITGKCYNGNATCWWLEGTTYEYQTRNVTYSYQYISNNWSSWQDAAIQNSSDKKVETQTLYRYRDRTKVYHFKRTVYGEWSGWTDTPASKSSTLDVETQQVYKYE